MAASATMCVECGDTAANLTCDDCCDPYCSLCFSWQHRKGTRAKHTTTPLDTSAPSEAAEGTTAFFMREQSKRAENGTQHPGKSLDEEALLKEAGDAGESEEAVLRLAEVTPLRMSEEERMLFRVVEGALEVSEYTDKVDVVGRYGWRVDNSEVMRKQLIDVLQLISGLQVCGHWKKGQALVKDRSLRDNEVFFKCAFELGRRYKIMNPDKMRTTYGKMMFIMQDAVLRDAVRFSVYAPLVTVHGVLEENDCLDLLKDPLLYTATQPVTGTSREDRAAVEAAVERKNSSFAVLCKKYAKEGFSEEEVAACLHSLADHKGFIKANQTPVDQMISYLTTYFDPNDDSKGSLALRYGMGGSKLSHTHSTQFTFVLQSLTLWREIMRNFYALWIAAEDDLLNERANYRLLDTGQGLNRVQSAPHVGRLMNQILNTVQSRVRGWVGLSVVHLGDRDVPNALVFIDKYTQVPRILAPIVQVIDRLPDLYEDAGVRRMIDKDYGGLDELRTAILADFFKHGFDGSGSDGGSCIDGRLTSSWNWCSRLEKKSYFHIFLLAGFQGFDGKF